MADSRTIAGLHSIRSALKHGAEVVEELWVVPHRKDRRIRELIDQATQAGIPVTRCSKETLDQMQPGVNHQGVAARVHGSAARDEAYLKGLLGGLELPPFLLVLDGVQDPHNLGACLRSAAAAGAHAVIAPKDRAVGLTPTVCKVASGAAGSIPFVQVTNLARTLRWLSEHAGIFLIGTASEADMSLYQAELTGPLALILGSEERGMRRLTRECCDQVVSLPMTGGIESLNVSVTAGVVLFEAVRQRR